MEIACRAIHQQRKGPAPCVYGAETGVEGAKSVFESLSPPPSPQVWPPTALAWRAIESDVRREARLRGATDMDDVVQESCLEIFCELQRSGEIAKPRAWLRCIVRRKIGRLMRTRDRRREVTCACFAGVEAGVSIGPPPLQDCPWLPGRGGRAFLERDDVAERLSPREQRLVAELTGGGNTKAEIARSMGCSTRDVRKMEASIARKLRPLAEKLRESGPPPGTW